jgi:hypothetical protein
LSSSLLWAKVPRPSCRLRFQGHHCRREGGVRSIDPHSNRSRLPAMMGSRLEESSPIADRWQPPEAWGACYGTAESKHIQNTSFWRVGRRNQDGSWLQAKCKSNGECNRSTSLSIWFFAFVRAVLLLRPHSEGVEGRGPLCPPAGVLARLPARASGHHRRRCRRRRRLGRALLSSSLLWAKVPRPSGWLRFQGHHCRREGGVGSIDPQSNRSRLPAMMESRPEESSLIADRWQPPEAWGACFGTAESKHIQNTSFWRGGRRNQDGPWLQEKCKSNGECNRSTSLSIWFFTFVRAVLLSRPPRCDFYWGHFPS